MSELKPCNYQIDRRHQLPDGESLDGYASDILQRMPTGSLTHRETWALKEWINTRHTSADVQQWLSERGMVAVDRSRLMGWYDVLEEAIGDSINLVHKQRAYAAIKQMIKAAQEKEQ